MQADKPKVSKLKHNPLLAWIVNKAFTADIFKPLLGWAKVKTKADLASNIEMSGASNNLLRLLETRSSNANTGAADAELADSIYKLIHGTESNVVIARKAQYKLRKKQALTQLEQAVLDKYTNTDEWTIPGTSLLQPQRIPAFRTLLNLRDLYLMIAIHETVNPEIRMRSSSPTSTRSGPQPATKLGEAAFQMPATSLVHTMASTIRVGEGCTDAAVSDIQRNVRSTLYGRNAKDLTVAKTYCKDAVLQNLREKLARASGETAQGEKAKDACAAAVRFVEEHTANEIFSPRFLNYDNFIPPFSQIAYQFSGGFLHHGVYLGSNAVIEVLNLDSGDTEFDRASSKTVKGFITFTHIFDFMKRARNNPSEVFKIEYKNPYPDNVIRDRAIWSLGRFPNYHITNENCESFATWVFTNEFESSMCIISKRTKPIYPVGIQPFNNFVHGGSTRRRRRRSSSSSSSRKESNSRRRGATRRQLNRTQK